MAAAVILVLIVIWLVWLWLSDDDQVLVVGDPAANLEEVIEDDLFGDQTVRVTGTVARFAVRDPFDPDLFRDFESQPAIVATSVEPVNEEVVDDDEQAGVSIEELADEDTELIGRPVTVTGEVEEVLGLQGFVLEG